MGINKLALLAGMVLSAILFSVVIARADEANQMTKMTFNQPVQIPGRVLPAGTYEFKLANIDDLNVVQIFNADGTRLYATLQTISAERTEPTGDTVLTMAEQPNGPEALVKWFYPGNLTGHEFVYSKHEEQQIAQDRQQTIVATAAAEAGD